LIDPFHFLDFFERGMFDGMDGFKCTQEQPLFFGSHAWNLFESGMNRFFAASGAVVIDAEAVCFIPDLLEQSKHM
jgi:hypothetical protein